MQGQAATRFDLARAGCLTFRRPRPTGPHPGSPDQRLHPRASRCWSSPWWRTSTRTRSTALHQGDDTAYTLGRVTLNPLPHIDPWMSLLLPALLWFGSSGQFTFGGAKPVPVNSRKFRQLQAGRHHRLGGRRHDQPGALAGRLRVLFVLLGLLARGAARRGAGAATPRSA